MAEVIHSTETFTFELVSPEKKLISGPAKMAVVPGTEGEFGVLPNHMPLIAALKPGVVQITLPDSAVQKIFIAGGFADVTAHSTTVLAEEAIAVPDLNQAKLNTEVKNLRDDLAAAGPELEKNRIRRRLAIATAKLEAVTGHLFEA